MKQHGLRNVSQAARKTLEALVEGLDELGGHRKLDSSNGAFMAVSVERVEETEHGPIFSVAHYFEQNGDLVPDPDVTILRATDGEFYPLSYQDGRTYRCSVDLSTEGGVRVDRDRQADLGRFVDGWMKNVKQQQGF